MVRSKRAERARTRSDRGGPRRRLANGLDAELFPGPAFDPEVISTPGLEELLASIERFDPAIDWRTARPLVRPMLPRRRPLPPTMPVAYRVMVPPGILTAFGLDIGRAFVYVTADHLDRWGIGPDALVEAAMTNVRRLAAGCDPTAVVTPFGPPGVRALLSRVGIGSSLLLAADLVPRFFGPEPVLLAAPMRDLLIALPIGMDREEAGWLAREIGQMDPNGLDLGLFRFADAAITAEPDAWSAPIM